MMTAVIVLIVLLIAIIYLISIYSGLIRLKNQIDNGFSQISVQLKRRHELIPNLVQTAKTYLSHESNTLLQVTNARNMAQQATDQYAQNPTDDNLHKLANSQNALSSALANFYAVVENYPQLKANDLLKQVMDELTNTENRIGFARQHYNDTVMFYNNKREEFPNNLISGFFNFHQKPQLQFADHALIEYAPKIDFV